MVSCLFFHAMGVTGLCPLSLHDALPISSRYLDPGVPDNERALARRGTTLVGSVKSGALVEVTARASPWREADRKSTRLNSSHMSISYAVLCLKKKIFTLSSNMDDYSHLT